MIGVNSVKLNVLGVVTARKGSKGLPGKNTKILGGRPLVEYTLAAAKQSKKITDLIVSTNCELVKGCAERLGVRVPFLRPLELSTDTSLHIDVLTHALMFMEAQSCKKYDLIVTLQPTSPFRKIGEIDNTIDTLIRNKTDSAVTVCEVGSWEHISKMKTLVGNLLYPVAADFTSDGPRQRLARLFRRSGSVYVSTRDCIINKKSLYGASTAAYVCDENFSVDIDGPKDWVVAEYIYEQIVKSNIGFEINVQ